MSGHGLTDPTPAPMGARRAEVLECLRDSAGALSVAAVAESTGLHVNTARFHLDALVEQGRAERNAEESGAPGRPRVLYRSRAQPSGPRSYRLLGQMLTGLVAGLDPDGSAALEAGRAWGRRLVDAAPAEPLDHTAALQRLTDLLDEVGFEPAVAPDDQGSEDVVVEIHHCPFLEVATESSEVVCAVHLGLMQGALEQVRAPLEVTGLQPFVSPHVCTAGLRSRPAPRT